MFNRCPIRRSLYVIALWPMLLGLLASAPLPAAHAASIEVDSTADTTANDGGCTLREAIINANSNHGTWHDCPGGLGADTITFDRYLAAITLTSALPQITDDLTINGLQGLFDRQVISGDGACRVFDVALAVTLDLRNVQVTRGAADSGAGLYVNSAARVTIHNSRFADNNVSGDGGAIYSSGVLTVTDSVLTDNTAASGGGAIANGNTLIVAGTDFGGNVASYGGAVVSWGGTSLSVTDSSFTANHALDGGGGAIDSLADATTIAGTTFTDNSASTPGQQGGAVHVNGDTLTITASDFISNTAQFSGGALRTVTDSGTIRDTTFVGNSSDDGGALSCHGALSVSASTFITNSANSEGGAIHVDSAALTVTGSDFVSNTAQYGGALCAANGTVLTLAGSTLTGNSASSSGGALQAWTTGGGQEQPQVTASVCTFDGNEANYGGAISHGDGVMLLDRVVLSDNSASGSGGAIDTYAALTVRNSLLTGNDAAAFGGAIYAGDALTVTGSTLVLNESQFHGGAISNYGLLTLTNSTLYRNTASSGGGALCNEETGSEATVVHSTFSTNGGPDAVHSTLGTLTLANSIVANSGAANCAGTVVDGGYNLQYGGTVASSCGASIETGDPHLGTPADNGGDTLTMALLAGSMALDRIPGAGGCGVGIRLDQRGVPRPSASGLCDIGAFEDNFGVFLPLVLRGS